MKPRIKQIVDDINDGKIDRLLNHFGNAKKLFHYLRGEPLKYIGEILLDDNQISDLYFIKLKYGDKEDEKKVIESIANTFTNLVQDGDEYYYEPSDLSDMAEWFEHYSRSDSSPRDVAKAVLGEDNWEPFYDVLNNDEYMSEVYDKLTPENQKYLRDVILNKYGNDLIGIPSEDITDTVLNIGTEDENGDYEFKITQKNIMDLFSDDKLMNYLFKNY